MKLRGCDQMKMPLWIKTISLLVLCPSLAWSLGMGDITVKSTLNEPLVAEIELLYGDVEEPETTEVKLASEEDYARIGLTRTRLGSPIFLQVRENDRGRYVIAVTTPVAINNPVIELLIEANWPNGRLLREYAVLLDPPVSAPTSRPQVSAIETPEATSRPTPVQRDSDTTTTPVTRPSIPDVSYERTEGDSWGPVETGDTLWSIASELTAGTDLTVNQMMVVLFENNPDAFFQDNINALKRGAILRLPDREQVNQTTLSSANSQVRQQNENWTGVPYSSSTPTVSDAGVDADYDSRSVAGGTRDSSRVELVPPSGTNDSGFESRGSRSSADAGELDELRAELARAEENLISTQLENDELRSRVSDLESLTDNYARTISLKDADLADLQNQVDLLRRQLAEQEAGAGTSDAFTADTSSTDTSATDSATDDFFSGTDATTSDDSSSADDFFADTGTTDTTTTDTSTDESRTYDDWMGGDTADDSADSTTTAATNDTATDTATDATTQPVADTRPPKPGMMDQVMDVAKNPYVIGGVVAGLLGIAGLVVMRRRSANKADSAGPIDMDDLPAMAVEEQDDRETELLQAIQADPGNAQSHLAVLRYYYSSRDTNAYVSAVEQMKESISDDSHPAWAEVKSMGRDLAPGLSLFAYDDELAEAATLEESTPTVSDDLEFDLSDLDGPSSEPSSGEIDLGDITDDDDSDLSFDLDDISADAADAVEEAVEHVTDTSGTAVSGFTSQTQDIADDVADELVEQAQDVVDTLDEAGDAIEEDLSLNLDDIDLDAGDELSLDLDTPEEEEVDLSIDIDLGDEADELDLDLDSGDDLAELDQVDEKDEPTEFELQAVTDEVTEITDTISTEPDTEELEVIQEQFDSEAETLAELEAVTDADLDSLGLDSLDIETDTEDQSSVATKLDLAKAYMEMGDPEGASSMLHEVKAEGNPAQQEEAERLLNEIGT